MASERPGRGRGRRTALVVCAVLATVLIFDGLRPPRQQIGAALALLAIDGYQATVSRALGRIGARCRFEPTCSHYGELAIRNRGLVPGAWLIVKRVARCGPWTPAGTQDPLPPLEPPDPNG